MNLGLNWGIGYLKKKLLNYLNIKSLFEVLGSW